MGIVTGTIVIPEVDSPEYDPCAEPSLAIEPTKEDTTVECYLTPEQIAFRDKYMEMGWTTIMMCGTPPEDDIPATSIMLRPANGFGIELLGCDTYSDEFRDDSYYIEREVYSWIRESTTPDALAKYASGAWGDRIYFFGGCRSDDFIGIDDFFYYDTITKTYHDLNNGGISARADCYGWCADGYFFLYGGYGVALSTPTWIDDFWKYNISTGEWTQLITPTGRISNKMVGGQPLIHIHSDSNPQNGFEQVKPNLEDVFFSKINTSNVLV